jgi:hypothetical protein
MVGTEKDRQVKRRCLGHTRVSDIVCVLDANAEHSRKPLEGYPPPLDWDKIAAELGDVKG